jgi:transposase-like protein
MTVHENGKVIQKHIRYIGKHGSGNATLTGGSSTPNDPRYALTVLPKPSVPKVTCKVCGGTHTRKYGTYKGVQNYYCDDCNTKFTGTDALANGRVSPTYIASALNEFYNGLSFHDIENNINQQTSDGISHTAVIKWINKFTNEAIKQTRELHPKVGDTWVVDETFIRVDKSKSNIENPYSKSRKAKWVVFWDIIDADTRFLLASHLATTRSSEDARALMLKAAQRAGKTPKVVVADKLRAYLDGVELAYGSDTQANKPV